MGNEDVNAERYMLPVYPSMARIQSPKH